MSLGYGLSPRAAEFVENRRLANQERVKTARCRCRDHNPLAPDCQRSVCLVSLREAGLDENSAAIAPKAWETGVLEDRLLAYLTRHGDSILEDIVFAVGYAHNSVRRTLWALHADGKVVRRERNKAMKRRSTWGMPDG